MWFIVHEERGALCDYGISALDVHMGLMLKGPFVKPVIFETEARAEVFKEEWFSLVSGLSITDTIPECYLWEAA